ncbi:MAG: hypothetical protein JW901_02150, partial [Dehalococcoidia bacterium]|nr:hypothetical protein [Dehalococcoidia bacterium]
CTYAEYIAAYNKLTYLMSQGKGDTPEAQAAYEEYAKVKACYESGSSGTGTPSTSTTATTTTTTTTSTAIISSGQTFNYPPSKWIPSQNGQSTVSLGQDQICISSMKPGGAMAYTKRDYDITSDYTVEFDYMVGEKDNHWIIVYSDGYLFLIIDWGTQLSHHQTGRLPLHLEVNRWYKIRMDAYPGQGTYDIYADGVKLGTALNQIGPSVGVNHRSEKNYLLSWLDKIYPAWDCIYLGDIDNKDWMAGARNRGIACWRNITVTGQPKGAVPQTTTSTPTTSTSSSGFGTAQVLNVGFKGNIYYLEEGTSQLPDFSKMTPVGTIYTEQLDIPDRDFTEGFPGITDRFEWFGISYAGGVSIPADGYYSFKLTSDDGAKLYIDGNLLIDNDGIHPSVAQTKQAYLTGGNHVIKVDYFQGPKTRLCLQLHVQTPDGGENPVKPGLDPSQIVSPPTTSTATTTTTTTTTSIPAGTALIAESRTVMTGGTVQVPIYFQDAQNLGSLGFTLSYDPAVVQVVKVSKGSLLSPATFTSSDQSGSIIFGFASPQAISGNGSAAVVEFRALGSAGSTSALTLSEILATSYYGSSLAVSPVNGLLTIGQNQPGDADGDGKLSVLDALIALKMYVKTLPLDLTADINQDGRVTPEDARLIMQKAKP